MSPHGHTPAGQAPAGAVLDLLGQARTVLLTTFRKNGTPVATPVWTVRDGDELLVWTNPTSGKYKRIRRDAAVTVVPCSTRGEPRGTAVPARARLLDDAELPALLAGIRAKYGVAGRVTVLSSVIGAWFDRRPQGGLAITLDAPDPRPGTTGPDRE
ncbi:PPOX class F420-dependent oxidoreductase [Nakamurella deserti]|uniref:PPOX class F420-dependent oxidoreductase n=1 Tax=Nakamurella deserti TaxID=2164074 RepID=UPI00197BA4BD|nr:PPOX class F420-dependent oxidoreductase [Nakamurella deserti]